MSVTGTWNVSMKSPIGEQKAILKLDDAGGSLSGTLGDGADSTPLTDTAIQGDTVSFSAKIVKPMPITLGFSGTVSGGTISGNVKFGGFGAGPFTATKA